MSNLSLMTDNQLISLTEQLSLMRTQLLTSESEVIEQKAKNNAIDTQVDKLKRDLKNSEDANKLMNKEVREITARKDKLENTFNKFD